MSDNTDQVSSPSSTNSNSSNGTSGLYVGTTISITGPSPPHTPSGTNRSIISPPSASLRYDRIQTGRVSALSPAHRDRVSMRSIDGLPGPLFAPVTSEEKVEDKSSSSSSSNGGSGSGNNSVSSSMELDIPTRSRGSSHSRQSSVLSAASLVVGASSFSRSRPQRPSIMLRPQDLPPAASTTAVPSSRRPVDVMTTASSRHVIMGTDGSTSSGVTSPLNPSSNPVSPTSSTPVSPSSSTDNLTVSISPLLAAAAAQQAAALAALPPLSMSTSTSSASSSTGAITSTTTTILPFPTATTSVTTTSSSSSSSTTEPTPRGSGSSGTPPHPTIPSDGGLSPIPAGRPGPKRSRDPNKRHSVVMMEFSPEVFRAYDKRNSLNSPSPSPIATPTASTVATTSHPAGPQVSTGFADDGGARPAVRKLMPVMDKGGDGAIPTPTAASSGGIDSALPTGLSSTTDKNGIATTSTSTSTTTTTGLSVHTTSTATLVSTSVDKKRSRLARERWKNAMAKVVATNKLAHMDLQKVPEEDLPANALPERLADYFIVFSCPRQPLDGIAATLRRAPERPLSELNKMVEQGNQLLANSEPIVFDRYPRHDHTKFPVDKAWGAWAFPDGLTLSVKKRPPACYHAVMTLAEGTQLFATYLRYDEPLLGGGNHSPPQSPADSPTSGNSQNNNSLMPPAARIARQGSGTGNILFEGSLPSEPPSPSSPRLSPATPAPIPPIPLPTSLSTGSLSTPPRPVHTATTAPPVTSFPVAPSTPAPPSNNHNANITSTPSLASMLPPAAHASAAAADAHGKTAPPLPATPPNPRVGPAKMVRKGTAPALLMSPPQARPNIPAPPTPSQPTPPLAPLSSLTAPTTPLTHSQSGGAIGSTPSVAPLAPPPATKPGFFDRMRKAVGGNKNAPSTPSLPPAVASLQHSASSASLLTSPPPAPSSGAAGIHQAPPPHPHPAHLMSPSTTSAPPSPRHVPRHATHGSGSGLAMFASPPPGMSPAPYLPSTPASARPISMSVAPPTPLPSALLTAPSTPQVSGHSHERSAVHSRTYSMPFAGATSPLALSELQAKMQLSQLYIPRTICLVSHYPIFDVMRKSLNEWYTMALDHNGKSKSGVAIESEIMLLISELPVPIPGLASVHWTINDSPMKCSFPSLRHPLTSNFPLWNLFNCLTVDHVLVILCGMLCEDRILFHSSSLSQLTLITQSFLQLLYPFQWWYAYIPVLAKLQLDAYQIPQPYILGIQSKYLGELTELPDDVIIVDIDHNSVRCNSPLTPLPGKLGRTLWERLRMAVERRAASRDAVGMTEEKISERFDSDVYKAVLRFYAEIFSGFRKFLFFIQEVPFFNGGSFLQAKCGKDPGSKPFFTKVLGSRAFDVFIEEELNPDGFHEVLHGGPGASTSRRLQVILEQERKQLLPFIVPPLQPLPHYHRERNGSLSIQPQSSPSSTTSPAFTFALPSPASVPSTPHHSLAIHHGVGATSAAAHLSLPQSSPTSISSISGASTSVTINPLPFTTPLSAYYWAQPRRIHIDGDTSFWSSNNPQSQQLVVPPTPGMVNPNSDELPTPAQTPAGTRRVSSQSNRLMVDKSRTRAKHLETKNNRQLPEELMKGYLSRIFGSSSSREAFTAADHSHIRSLLIDGKVRASVGSILRQPQSGGTASLCLGTHAYRDMAFVLTVLLDYCMSQKDYANAIAVLESGNIFFSEDTVSGARTFIERELTPHIFWRDLAFWRFILESSINERVKDLKQPVLQGKALSEFVLSAMIKMVSQMHSHNLPAPEVWRCVDDMCHKHHLDKNQVEEVKRFWTNLENLRVAMAEAEDYSRL